MNRTKATIAIIIALSIVATTLILPILAPLIRELHLSVVQGGLMLTIGSVAMVVAAPLWGIVSDRYGRKKTIVAGGPCGRPSSARGRHGCAPARTPPGASL